MRRRRQHKQRKHSGVTYSSPARKKQQETQDELFQLQLRAQLSVSQTSGGPLWLRSHSHCTSYQCVGCVCVNLFFLESRSAPPAGHRFTLKTWSLVSHNDSVFRVCFLKLHKAPPQTRSFSAAFARRARRTIKLHRGKIEPRSALKTSAHCSRQLCSALQNNQSVE